MPRDDVNFGEAEFLAAEREYARRSLRNYIRLAWPIVEQGTPFVDGHVIGAMSEHLEAVSAGEITRLAIAVPPGSMKSLTVGVFWPLWEWGPLNRPSLRTVAASHSEPLAVRDNLRAQRLVKSEWFQNRWGSDVVLTGDQNAKSKFENSKGGFRQATPFRSLTGSRGDRVILDDVMSVDDAKSEPRRHDIIETFTEAVPTRLNDPRKSAIVVVMQRLHEEDVIGCIEARNLGYDMLVLPMEFEPDRKCYTSIGFEDWRTEDGELLFPERFPREVVDRDKDAMGEFATAAQFQQRPVPRKGGLFQADRIRKIHELPLEPITWCRGWDLAGSTEMGSAFTASVKLGYAHESRRYIIADVNRDRLTPYAVRTQMKRYAESDGKHVYIVFPKDPGQAGKAQAQDIAADLAGYPAKMESQTGDKVTRAEPFSSQVEAGNVDMVDGPWNDVFLGELRMFPRGRYKDQTDAASSAFNFLADKVRVVKEPELRISGGKQRNWASPS